jgi:hypothetical protein
MPFFYRKHGVTVIGRLQFSFDWFGWQDWCRSGIVVYWLPKNPRYMLRVKWWYKIPSLSLHLERYT